MKNKMAKSIKTIVLYTLIFVQCVVYSQIPIELIGTCGYCDDLTPMEVVETDCSHLSSLYSNDDLWQPSANDEIKYVRVNFIFLHEQDNGLGNFVSGNQEHESIIAELVSQINAVYSNLFNPNDPNCHINEGFISDTRIQIIPNVIHYTNPYYWNNENQPGLCPSTWNGQWLDILDVQIVNDSSIENAINVYFTENATEFYNLVVNQTTQNPPATIVGCSYPPKINNFSSSSRIHMPGVFSKYYWMKNYAPIVYNEPWNSTIRGWFITSVGNQIAHELGHSLSLSHVSPCHYNLMSLEPSDALYHAFLTPSEIGKIHRYLSISSIRKYTTDDSFITIPYLITTDTEWDLNFTSFRDVVIESGATLTITCKLVMKSNAKIIVKQGGRLIVDGGIITTEDSKLWSGIEVWGNSSDHQQYVNGGYLQGYLELRNGATIENAICAVELWRPNHNNTTGGIIFAKDAVFRNNRKAVHAKDYTNFYPTSGGEAPYNAIFRHCEFIIDDDYMETETFYKHVDIANVNGIKFQGCEFSVSPNSNGASAWCMGIGAYSAGFTVDSYCENSAVNPCPDNSLYRSTFTGFNNGILSVNEGNNAKTFSVRDAVFTNNHRGIFAHNTGYVTILNNEFNIGCNLECGYGVYAVGVTGFCIEENVFRPVMGSSCTTYGIGIFKSGSINDIYKNNFEYLTFGNVSVGVNYSDNNDGLTYTCNENIGNGIDFCVLNEGNVGGVRSQQGSASSPAGNTFSGPRYHFYNGTDSRMQYYYNSGNMNETPDVLKLNSITPIPTTYSNSCLSHYGSGGVIKSPKEKAALAEIYKTSEDAHERYMAAGDIVRSDLNDSVANPEELRLWLGNMNEIAADRMIVASYIQEGDFKNAFALANTLPDIYQLKGDDLDDHNDYMAIVSLYQKLYNTDRTVREMTDDEKKMVEDIADNGIGTSQLMARGIMMEIGDRYIEPYVCPDMPRDSGGRGEMIHNNYEYEENNVFAVKLSPIPATTWVSVDYQLPEKATKATMTVMSPLGNVVMDIEFSGNKGTKALDLRDLPNGVYTYIVKCGYVVKSGKLVVTK